MLSGRWIRPKVYIFLDQTLVLDRSRRTETEDLSKISQKCIYPPSLLQKHSESCRCSIKKGSKNGLSLSLVKLITKRPLMQFFCCIMHEKKLLKLHQIWIERSYKPKLQTMKKIWKTVRFFLSLEKNFLIKKRIIFSDHMYITFIFQSE